VIVNAVATRTAGKGEDLKGKKIFLVNALLATSSFHVSLFFQKYASQRGGERKATFHAQRTRDALGNDAREG